MSPKKKNKKNITKQMTPKQEADELQRVDAPAVEPVKEKPTPVVTDAPKEGDKRYYPSGDYDLYKNGTWVYMVSGNPDIGQ